MSLPTAPTANEGRSETMDPSNPDYWRRYSTFSVRSFDSDTDLSYDGSSLVGGPASGGFTPSGSWGQPSALFQTPAAATDYARPPPPWVANDGTRALPLESVGRASSAPAWVSEQRVFPQVVPPPAPASDVPTSRADSSSSLDSPEVASLSMESLLSINGLPLHSAFVSDRTVFYVDSFPDGGPLPPADRTILLLHAIPMGPHSLRKLLPLLVARGFRVIAPTLRGFNPGDPKPRVADAATRNAFYSWRASAADLVGLLAVLGLEKVIVAGSNFGTQMASALALLYPSVVSKLVMLSGPYIPPAETYIPPAMMAAKADPSLGVRVYLGTDRAVEGFNEHPALLFHIWCRPGGAEEFQRVAGLARRLFGSTSQEEARVAVDELMKNPSSLITAKETLFLVRWADAIGGAGGFLQWHRVEASTVAEFQGVPREIHVPLLYIGAEFHEPSAPAKRADMKRLCPNLTEVILAGAGTWIGLEKATEVADLMADWIRHGQISERVMNSMDLLDGAFSSMSSFGGGQGF